MLKLTFLILLGSVTTALTVMEGFIVGGKFANIKHHAHSAFLNVNCVLHGGKRAGWICGSSVVNQQILLTAAHCLYGCTYESHIGINLGNEHRNRGSTYTTYSFVIHEDYHSKTSSNDISLIRVDNPLLLSMKISRVALMKKPPYTERATVAGWGMVDVYLLNQAHQNGSAMWKYFGALHLGALHLGAPRGIPPVRVPIKEKRQQQSDWLKFVTQKVWSRNDCVEVFRYLSRGTICAANEYTEDYASQGDSGSALIVRGYIQIGLVSYKIPSVSRYIVVYTDVGYFYDWIRSYAKQLACIG